MSKHPNLPFHTGDYRKSTPTICFATWLHHGIYLLSLIIAWDLPHTKLPDDRQWLAHHFGCTIEQIEEFVIPVLQEYYKKRKGFWYQKRLLKERKYVVAHSQKQSSRAKARWDKEKNISRGNAAKHAVALPRHQNAGNAPSPSPSVEEGTLPFGERVPSSTSRARAKSPRSPKGAGSFADARSHQQGNGAEPAAAAEANPAPPQQGGLEAVRGVGAEITTKAPWTMGPLTCGELRRQYWEQHDDELAALQREAGRK